MTTIVTRAGKGSPLTNTEVDSNFSNLNTDKLELGGTFSSGTANSILYLNGSKVLTSGSALSFDGTNLGLGQAAVPVGSSPVFEIHSGANNGILKFTNSTTGTTNSDGTWIYQPAGSNNFIVQNQESAGDLRLYSTAHIWGNHNYSTEYMRLTSTGLGIGTSSPDYQLVVSKASDTYIKVTNTSASITAFYGAGSTGAYVGTGTNHPIQFIQNGSEQMRLVPDNLLFGTTTQKVTTVTGSATGLTIGGASAPTIALWDTDNAAYVGYWSQINNTMYFGNNANGSIEFGTNSTTKAILTADGNLGLGVTPSGSFKLEVAGGDASIYGITVGRGAGASLTNTAVGASALAANTTGIVNVAVGQQALLGNTTGSYNVAVGRNNLYTNTTGNDNIAIGFDTLYYNNGDHNVALGGTALGANTTGNNNTALGGNALLSNTTASNNTAVGYQAGYTNTTGEITGVGYASLFGNTTGTYNTAVGVFSLFTNTTGGANTALGRGALRSNTTSSNNTAVGYEAGYSNTTGANNQVFGYQALYANQTGSNNAAFGTGALSANTGSDNAAFGSGVTAVAGGALVSNTSGERNSAFGGGAASSNTTGSYNTALGTLALKSNTTANANTAVGYQASYANTAAATTAVGYRAAASNTTGTKNDSFGTETFENNTTGSYNVAIGTQALRLNTTASNNTAVGYQAAYGNTTATRNTAVGTQALYSNATNNDNTAVGYQSQFSITGGQNTTLGTYAFYAGAGNNNVAIGYLAMGDSGKNGNANVAIGSSALQKATTANTNIAIGGSAMQETTSGAQNTAVGYQALYTNTTGYVNSAFGYRAGFYTTTGVALAALGREALYNNITGSNNSAFGDQALYNNTTASSNTAMGTVALYFNTTGANNTGIGQQALYSNTTASNNTAVGYQAGYSNTTGYGDVFIGHQAGYSSTGNNNTFLGQGSGTSMTTGGANTILGRYSGNQGGLDIRTADGYIVLSDGDGNPRQVIDGSGNVGIGTGSPGQKLHVDNSANSSTWIKVSNGSNGAGAAAGVLFGNDGGDLGAMSLLSSANNPANSLFLRSLSTNPLVFGTNNTERARITSGGDLLVGRTDTDASERISVYNGSSANFVMNLRNDAATQNWIRFAKSGGTAIGSITGDGTNTAYNTSSDYRLKDNPQPLTNSGAFIDALQPKTWNWKETGKKGVGFIAHEVQTVSPGSVVGEKDAVDADGNPIMQAMEYGSAEFIANIIAELQSLRARVAQLEGN